MSVDKLLSKKTDTSFMKSATLTPNGAMFKTNTKGFLPEIMESMYNDRVKYKNSYYNLNKNMRIQKTLNFSRIYRSMITYRWRKRYHSTLKYGAIGNQYFRYYDLLIAEGITTSGQLSIRWIEKYQPVS